MADWEHGIRLGGRTWLLDSGRPVEGVPSGPLLLGVADWDDVPGATVPTACLDLFAAGMAAHGLNEWGAVSDLPRAASRTGVLVGAGGRAVLSTVTAGLRDAGMASFPTSGYGDKLPKLPAATAGKLGIPASDLVSWGFSPDDDWGLLCRGLDSLAVRAGIIAVPSPFDRDVA